MPAQAGMALSDRRWWMVMASDRVVGRDGSPWFRRLARLMRRFPWMARGVQRVMHVIQPRFTLGGVGVLLDASGRQVLLVEHVFHAKCPWGLPGGWIGRGEEPSRAVEREFCEETGLRVRVVRPLWVGLAPEIRRHLDVAFLCELDGEQPSIRLSNELLSYRWTPLDDLPLLVAAQRKILEALRDD